MLHVALWEPQIPPNTGNIARLCAATRSPLHLIGRLGFRIDDRAVRRAGLDYWHAVTIHRHDSLAEFHNWRIAQGHDLGRCWAFSAHVQRPYTDATFRANDCLLFGNETYGLPAETLAEFRERIFTIPMPGRAVRSLNLATAVGIVLYEGLRQLHAW